jgi:methionyl-tRNA formyltransferase
MVVAAYGLILPQAVLDLPAFGCINIHASLLPRWRGAAPVQRAILAGDAETGCASCRWRPGWIAAQSCFASACRSRSDDTAAALSDRLAELGARLIVDALARLPLPAQAQAETGITYAAKIDKAEAPLDWRLPAARLERQIRAFNPHPGATGCLDGHWLKVWRGGKRLSAAQFLAGTALRPAFPVSDC